MPALYELCAYGKLDEIRAALARGGDVNDKNANGSTVGWAKKSKFLIWAFLFAGHLQNGVRDPPKKFQIYRPINDRWQAISILGHF